MEDFSSECYFVISNTNENNWVGMLPCLDADFVEDSEELVHCYFEFASCELRYNPICGTDVYFPLISDSCLYLVLTRCFQSYLFATTGGVNVVKV